MSLNVNKILEEKYVRETGVLRFGECVCDLEFTGLPEGIKEIIAIQYMQTEGVFYYASLIHLVFAHIHPFRDGNGRAARLLEKWFIAEKLGEIYWNLPSEKYYKENQSEYYKNINLGINYYELNYDKCIPFLTMLPKCMKKL